LIPLIISKQAAELNSAPDEPEIDTDTDLDERQDDEDDEDEQNDI
jgi:hypothetical protein